MGRLYVGEYGKRVLIDCKGIDFSGQTNIELIASAPPTGTGFINSVSVSVLGTDTTTSTGKIISASTGVEYVLNQGDIDASGTWRFHLVVDFGSTKRLISSGFEKDVLARGE